MMFPLIALIFSTEVKKTIGKAGDCQLTATFTEEGTPVVPTVTNATKLTSLFHTHFVYSNASFSQVGNCSALNVFDHAKNESPVGITTLQNKNATNCDLKASQRHYMFDFLNATGGIEQEWNLYYVCPKNATSSPASTISTMAVFASIALAIVA